MQTMQCELLVVGAGPAGLSAAAVAAALGVDTLLLDEQPGPGGQIYRAITTTPLADKRILGADYWHGESLLEPFRASGARHEFGATVGSIARAAEDSFDVSYGAGGQARQLHAKSILLATGARERPFSIPGDALPGVGMAGAAQNLLKSEGRLPEGRAVLAGCGPLLYLLAWQYLNAGVKIERMLETAPPGRFKAALPHLFEFLLSSYRSTGLKLVREVKAAIPIVKGVQELKALGRGKLESVQYTAQGRVETVQADQLMLHQGVAPNADLSRIAGVEHEWNPALDCWQPRIDAWGETSVPGISIAGDCAGIAGARAAEYRGLLAALNVACELGHTNAMQRDRDARPYWRALAQVMRGRAFFDALYKAPDGSR